MSDSGAHQTSQDTLQDCNAGRPPESNRLDYFVPYYVKSVTLLCRDQVNSTLLPGSHQGLEVIPHNVNEPPSSVHKVQPGVQTRTGCRKILQLGLDVVQEEEVLPGTPVNSRLNISSMTGAATSSTPSFMEEVLIGMLDHTADRIEEESGRLSLEGGGKQATLPLFSPLDSSNYHAALGGQGGPEGAQGLGDVTQTDPDRPHSSDSSEGDGDDSDRDGGRDSSPSPEPDKPDLLNFTKMILSKIFTLVNDGARPGTFEFGFLYHQNRPNDEFYRIFDNHTDATIKAHVKSNARILTQSWVNDFLARNGPDDKLVSRDLDGIASLGRLMTRMKEKNYPWARAMAEMIEETPEGDYPEILAFFKAELENISAAQGGAIDLPHGVYYGDPLGAAEYLQHSLPGLETEDHKNDPCNIFGYVLEYLAIADVRLKENDMSKAQIKAHIHNINSNIDYVKKALTYPHQIPGQESRTDEAVNKCFTDIYDILRDILVIVRLVRDDWSHVNKVTCRLFNIGITQVKYWEQIMQVPTLPDEAVLMFVPIDSPTGTTHVTDSTGVRRVVDSGMAEFHQKVHDLKKKWKEAKDVALSTTPFVVRKQGQRRDFSLHVTCPPVRPQRVPTPPAAQPSPSAPGGPLLRPQGHLGGVSPGTQRPPQPQVGQQQRPHTPTQPGTTSPVLAHGSTQSGQPPLGTRPSPLVSQGQGPPVSHPAATANALPPGPPPGASAAVHPGHNPGISLSGVNDLIERYNNREGNSRYRSEREDQEDQKVFERVAEYLKEAKFLLDSSDSVGALDVAKGRLHEHSKAMERLAHRGIAIPNLLFNNELLSLSQHVDKLMGLIFDKVKSKEQVLKEKLEWKKQALAKYRNEIPKIKFATLTGQHNWLYWRAPVIDFVIKVEPADNDAGVHAMLYDSLSPENKKDVSTVNPSISGILNRFEIKYQKNVVQKMIDVNIATLPVPGRNQDQVSLCNITRVLENIVLITNYNRLGDLTLSLLSKIELVSFTPFYKDLWRDLLATKESALDDASGGDFTNLNSTLQDATDLGQSILDGLCRVGTAAAPTPNSRSGFVTLSARERTLTYIAFTKQVMVKLNNAAAEDGASEKQVKPSSGSAHFNVETATVMYNNRSNNTRKATPAPTIKPQLPCPLRSQGCDHTTTFGSAFHCIKFRKLDKTSRAACVKNDKLCVLCLQKSHPAGVLCSFRTINCSICKKPGEHNRRSGLCPMEETQPEGIPVQVNLENDDDSINDQDRELGFDEDVFNAFNGTDDEYPELDFHVCDAEDYTPPIEKNFEKFRESLIRPNPYSSAEQPDVPPDQLLQVKEALERIRVASSKAAKTGKSELQLAQEKESDRVISQIEAAHCALVMNTATTDESESLTQIDTVMQDNNLKPQDLRDRLLTKDTDFPFAINHSSRSLGEVEHLRVTPKSRGKMRKMFDTIHRTAVTIHKKYPKTIMQQVTVALLIENPEAFPGDVSHMMDTKIIRENGQRFLLLDALLDSGCSLVMLEKEVIHNLMPARMTEFKQNITTGNGLVRVNDYQYEIMMRTTGGKSVIKTLGAPLRTGTLGVQPGLSEDVQKIIHEELRTPENRKNEISFQAKPARPYILLGLNAIGCQPRPVCPLTHGCRPPLFSPNLKLWQVDVAYGDEDQTHVCGTLGMDPTLYSATHNTPAYFVQEENLEKGELLPWQMFNPHLLLDIAEKENPHNEAVFLAMTDITKSSTRVVDPKVPPLRPILENSLSHIAEMNERWTRDPIQDESCMFLSNIVQEDMANINLVEVREVEKFVESEAGIFVPRPVCAAHQKIWSSVVEKCPDCLKSADPDAERKKLLALEIKRNLHVVSDPENEGKPEAEHSYTLVQKHVNEVSIELAGHISVSSFASAYKSSEKLVRKLSGKTGLASLAKQNREYLETDKQRILTPEQLHNIAEGKTPAMWYHKNLVYKPDSLRLERWFINLILTILTPSTAIRMIVDSSRKVREMPYTQSSNNPVPKGQSKIENRDSLSVTLLIYTGYTPSLSAVSIRFCFHERYIALDVSKYFLRFSLISQTDNCPSRAYHAIRLDSSDFLTFCSVWFESVLEHGTKFPYATHSTTTDFGMGQAHMSLGGLDLTVVFSLKEKHFPSAGGIQIAGTFCKDPESLAALLRELFVDNIGLSKREMKRLFAIMVDIIKTLRRFKLNIDKIFMPLDYLDHPDCPPGLTIPQSTQMFGLIWELATDCVLPRIKLHWHGFTRGKPNGGPLEDTDVFNEILSRRVFARLMASFFDVMGRYLGPAVAQIKLRCKRLIVATPGAHLDQDIRLIDPELDTQLKVFWDSFKHIQTRLHPHPRTVVQYGRVMEYLTICHDASPRMIGSCVHAITSQESQMFSNIFGSKSALHSGTGNTTHSQQSTYTFFPVPRNEKLSMVQAVDLLLAIVSALDREWEDNQKVYILGDRFATISHITLSQSTHCSTIASYLFAGESYNGDGLSRATFLRVTAALTVVGKFFPNMTICFAWIQAENNGCSDMLTKEYSPSGIINLLNGPTWREGADILKQPEILEKFKFYEWKGASGVYTPLPDYLKKMTSHSNALLMDAACNAEDDSPLAMAMLHGDNAGNDFSSSEKLPAPQDENLLFCFFMKPHAVQTFINVAAKATDHEASAVVYAALRSGKNTHQLNNSAFLPSDNSVMLKPSTATVGSWNNRTKQWSTGIKTTKETRDIKKDTITNIKVKCLTKPASRVRLIQPGTPIKVPRLPANCYTMRSLLHGYQGDVIDLAPYNSVHDYLEGLNKFEMLHAYVNFEASSVKAAIQLIGRVKSDRSSLRTVSAEQIWVSTWIRIIKSDQKFFPPSGGNMHQNLGIVFNKFRVEEEAVSKHIGSANVPLLAKNSPLLMKSLLSCHKQYLELNRTGQAGESDTSHHSVHSSTVRTLCILTTGFFSVTCNSLRSCATKLLRSCEGCRRHKEQFYKTQMGGRYVKAEINHGAFTRCSFDELGPCVATDIPGGRKTISFFFYIFVCLDVGAVTAIPAYKINGNALQQAVQGLVWRTGATPQELHCDGYSTHVNIKEVGTIKIVPNVPHSKHRNYVENRIREIKRYLRALSNSQKVEPLHLGSLTVLDYMFVMDSITYCINSVPLSPESPLCPAQIIWPGTVNSLMSEHLEDEVFTDLATGRNARLVDRLLREYRDIVFNERSKTLLALQKDLEKGPRHHDVKKGKRSYIQPQVGDIVLLDYEDGKKLRLAKIISLNETKTTAELLVNKKSKFQAVASLRVLSTYREQPPEVENNIVSNRN